MPAASAGIFLAFDLFEDKLALDDVDHLAVLGAFAHFTQSVAAAGADLVGLIEFKILGLHLEVGLGTRAASTPFGLVFGLFSVSFLRFSEDAPNWIFCNFARCCWTALSSC